MLSNYDLIHWLNSRNWNPRVISIPRLPQKAPLAPLHRGVQVGLSEEAWMATSMITSYEMNYLIFHYLHESGESLYSTYFSETILFYMNIACKKKIQEIV